MHLSAKFRKYILVLIVCIVIFGLALLGFLSQSGNRVSIASDSQQTRIIGEEIIITGTCTGQDEIYLFITSPNLPGRGRTLENPTLEVIDKNSSTFSFTQVNTDNTWIFKWNTSGAGLQPGTYTIYVAASPRDSDHVTETRAAHIMIALKDFSIRSRIKVLITGFEEFGGYSKNPSEELVHFINSVRPDSFSQRIEIRGVVLPVLYYDSWNRLHDEIVKYQPDVVLCYGFSPGSDSVSLERTAYNYDGGFPDNNNIRHNGPVVEGGPSYYHSSLPLADLEKDLKAQGIPVRVSDNAGSYICNHIFYQLMNYYRDDNSRIAGFIHLPGWETDRDDHNLSRMFNTTITVIENRYYPTGTSR
jgi:pyroglutamyl-peptidase